MGQESIVEQLLKELLAATGSSERDDATAVPPPTVRSEVSSTSSTGQPDQGQSTQTGQSGHIASIRFSGYKALNNYTLHLSQINILTGANNAGKSTALSALRILASGLGVAGRHRALSAMETPSGRKPVYVVPTDGLPVSLENIRTDLKDDETTVLFQYANGGELVLWFPADGACLLYVGDDSAFQPKSPTEFRRQFRPGIVHVPVLGPLEHNEQLLNRATVTAGLATHRAARHFRNYWYYFPEAFDRFAELVSSTWPGMEIEKPELLHDSSGPMLRMFCREERMTRELYWAGFGFQIWCQLLTHISRATAGDILVIDEPETYLHPAVQRRLLEVLRRTGSQIVAATHSASIVMAAGPNEVVCVDRADRVARRLVNMSSALALQLGIAEHL